MTPLTAGALQHTSTAEAVAFWVLGAVAVLGAIAMVAAPKAVYSDLSDDDVAEGSTR